MAHFAKLNRENIVEEVLVVNNEMLYNTANVEDENTGVDFLNKNTIPNNDYSVGSAAKLRLYINEESQKICAVKIDKNNRGILYKVGDQIKTIGNFSVLARVTQVDENSGSILDIVCPDIIEDLSEDIIVIIHDTENVGHVRWKQTSYNASFRKKFAGIGDYYNDEEDAFYPHPCKNQAEFDVYVQAQNDLLRQLGLTSHGLSE